MYQVVVRYESVTSDFHSYGYLLDLQGSHGNLDLCLDADKDYWPSVYELYSNCHEQMTGHIGKWQMYMLCRYPSRSLQIIWITVHGILCLSGMNRHQVSHGKVMSHILINFPC